MLLRGRPSVLLLAILATDSQLCSDQYSCAPNLYPQPSRISRSTCARISLRTIMRGKCSSTLARRRPAGAWPPAYGVNLDTVGLTTDLMSHQMPGLYGQLGEPSPPMSDSDRLGSDSPQQLLLVEAGSTRDCITSGHRTC